MRGAAASAVKVHGVSDWPSVTLLSPREHFDVLLAAAASGDDGALEAAVGVGLGCSGAFEEVARANALAAAAAATPGGIVRVPALLGPLIACARRERGPRVSHLDPRTLLLHAIRGARPLTAAHEAAPLGDVVAAAVALLEAAEATEDPRAEEVLCRDWLQHPSAEDDAAERPLLAPPAYAALRAARGTPGAATVARRVAALLQRMWVDSPVWGGDASVPWGARRVSKTVLQLVASGGSGGNPDLL
jgi:hypothetical protein